MNYQRKLCRPKTSSIAFEYKIMLLLEPFKLECNTFPLHTKTLYSSYIPFLCTMGAIMLHFFITIVVWVQVIGEILISTSLS